MRGAVLAVHGPDDVERLRRIAPTRGGRAALNIRPVRQLASDQDEAIRSSSRFIIRFSFR